MKKKIILIVALSTVLIANTACGRATQESTNVLSSETTVSNVLSTTEQETQVEDITAQDQSTSTTQKKADEVSEKVSGKDTEKDTEKVTDTSVTGKDSEKTTQSPSKDEKSSEESAATTKVTTQKPTEKVTEKTTVVTTKATTQKATEKATEKVTTSTTKATTQKPTEKVTEKPTVATTKATTQKATEKATEKPTVATTKATTQKPTEKPTEKTTIKPITKPTETTTQKPTEATTKSNCEIYGHLWVNHYVTQTVHHKDWVLINDEWDEPIYETREYCNVCGIDLTENYGGAFTSRASIHLDECQCGWTTSSVVVGYNHHDAEYDWYEYDKNERVVDYTYCIECGMKQ